MNKLRCAGRENACLRAGGFTLIELMIVVAIVAILLAIALPSYQNQVIKSRRTDAQRELVSWAQALERHYTANAQYGDCSDGKPSGKPSNNYYTISIAAAATDCTDTTFTLSAVPIGGTSQANDGTLTLDNTGARVPADKWKY